MPTDASAILYDVFISYARKDASMGAEHLDAELKAHGCRTWRDVNKIDPTQDFAVEIEDAIEASKYIVICVTPDVKRRESFVRREIGYAEALGKPILVARFADVVPPITIINHTRFDFFIEWENSYKRLFQQITNDAVETNLVGVLEPISPDSQRTYVEKLLLNVVGELRRSVFSNKEISLRTVESIGDVSLKTKYVNFSPKETQSPNNSPTEFISLHAAYDNMGCNGRVVLLGEPGAGKTTSLLAFARDAAAARLNDQTEPLPLFARISDWDSYAQTPLADWLTASLEGIKADQLAQLIANGSVLLLLDGLDELGNRRPVDPSLPDGEQYDPRERFLKLLPRTGNVILTSRVQEFRQIGELAGLNCAILLQKLDDPQMESYLADVPDLWDTVLADETLKEALRTPLLLALFRIGFEESPQEARTLSDLSVGALNERIWDEFIDRRWAFEQARAPDHQLAYTTDELKLRLGKMVVTALGEFRLDHTRFLVSDMGGSDAQEVIALAQRLDLLVEAGDKQLSPFSRRLNEMTYRFLHMRLRDALAFSAACIHLRDLDRDIGSRAAESLGKLGDARAVEPLINALHHSDGDIRSSAADALVELGGVGAVEPLITALRDPVGDVRLRAAYVLGKLGDARAVDPLITALYDPNEDVCRRASAALVELGNPQAVDPLIAALRDPNGDVRRHAAYILGELGDTRAIESLIAALRDSDRVVRLHAAAALVQLRDVGVQPLIAALHDSDVEVRFRAAVALTKLGDEAVEPLIAALRDTNEDVRQRIIDILGKLRDVRSVEPLIAALHDPMWSVRKSAAIALGQLEDKQAVESLIIALRDPDGNVRSSAATALGRLGDGRATNSLIAALSDPDDDVRNNSADALAQFPDDRKIRIAVDDYHSGKIEPRDEL